MTFDSTNQEIQDLEGSGKGSGGTFADEQNTLLAVSTAKILHLISEGDILGYVGGSDKATYLNGTPIVDPSGNVNFGGKVRTQATLGTPNQPLLSDFSNSVATTSVDTEVLAAVPVTRTISDSLATKARITIGIQGGLYKQDSDGLKPTSLTFRLETKLTSESAWVTQRKITYNNEKTTSDYRETFSVTRPSNWTSGTWDVRLFRETPDSTDVTLHNKLFFSTIAEVVQSNLTYPDLALVGIVADAKSVGNSIPKMSFLVDGRIVRVPNTYIGGRYNQVIILDKLPLGDSQVNYQYHGNVFFNTTPTGDYANGARYSEITGLWHAGNYPTTGGQWVNSPCGGRYNQIIIGSANGGKDRNRLHGNVYFATTPVGQTAAGERFSEITGAWVAGTYPTTVQWTDPPISSASWDGVTFKYQWSNNPAWILLDLLTDTTYGLGNKISTSQVDVLEFMTCAVYNDNHVRYTYSGITKSVPRFTFNWQFTARDSAWKMLDDLAGSFLSRIIVVDGLISLFQDRPSSTYAIIHNSNVVDGNFEMSGTAGNQLRTQLNVTWYDPNQQFQSTQSTIDFTASDISTYGIDPVSKYGLVSQDIVAVGCTSNNQAIRFARHKLYELCRPRDVLTFKMGFNGFDLQPGHVISVMNANRSGRNNGGKLKSGSTTTSLNLEAAVTLSPNSSITLYDSSGNLITRNISQTSGSLSTITLTAALPSAPAQDTDYVISTDIVPQLFRVMGVKQESQGVVKIDCVEYDPMKYAFADELAPLAIAPRQNLSVRTNTSMGQVQALTLMPSVVRVDSSINRKLMVSWSAPTIGTPVIYTVDYTADGSRKTFQTSMNEYELSNLPVGQIRVSVYATNAAGITGQASSANITFTATEGGGSALSAPTGVTIKGGGYTWGGRDLVITWTNPSTNGNGQIKLKDFKIVVYNSAGTVLNTFYVDPVNPGATQSFTYTFNQNMVDTNGSPNRILDFEVYCRDANLLLSASGT